MKNIIFQKWRNYSGSGSGHVSNALENHVLIVASPASPCKTQTNTLLRPKMACNLIWCRNYRHLVALKTLRQLWMCFPAVYWHTRHQIRTPKPSRKVLINIMTRHAYLPTTLISDKGTAFMSRVIKEVAGVLGITLKHATTKHAQTIGLLERSHASMKQALRIETGERRSLWHKYINIAVLN